MTIGVLSVIKGKSHDNKGVLEQEKEKALGAQNYRCACCGIGLGQGHVGIGFEDSDQQNLYEENVLALCIICEALRNGGQLNKAESAGFIVYLPDLSQVELIRMLHAYVNLKITDPESAGILQSIQHEELNKLKQAAKKYLNFSETTTMRDFLENMHPDVYNNRVKALGPIRFWPDIENKKIREAMREYSKGLASKDDIKELEKRLA